MIENHKSPDESEDVPEVPRADDDIVRFENPPVIEVVCGIGFEEIEGYSSPQMGLFWNDIREQFPISEVKAPLPSPTGGLKIDLNAPPQAPRYFLRSNDRSELVQLQENRFLYNWIKTEEKPLYPRYSFTISQFNTLWKQFKGFLTREGLKSPVIRELRLQYVNHMIQGEGWETLSQIQNVFPDYSFDERGGRYLTPPSTWAISSNHDLPFEGARIEISIKSGRFRPGIKDEKELLAAELLVIGNVKEPESQEIQDWFDRAREAIDRTFVEITNPDLQVNVWQRKD